VYGVGSSNWWGQVLCFKWGALLLSAAMGWLSFAVLHFCWPVVQGLALDSSSGHEVQYSAILNMNRSSTYRITTDVSRIISAASLPTYTASGVPCYIEGKLLAFDSYWDAGPLIQALQFKLGLSPVRGPAPADIDSQSRAMLDWVVRYLNDLPGQQRDGIRYGFSPAGKAQVMRNMLEVLRRHGESKYVTPLVIPQLMLPLDHPAGPDDVPTAKQIYRKAAQFL
jgi:hypothetical protein